MSILYLATAIRLNLRVDPTHYISQMRKPKFKMVDAPLKQIFVHENEELKIIDHVNTFKKIHPVPLKLLRDLKIILVKRLNFRPSEKARTGHLQNVG
jgi:hypothetical protein